MTQATATRSTALTALLGAYIAGRVGDAVMARFDDLFVDSGATADERLAFARFYLDALASGEAEEALPAPAEVSGILAVARA